MWSVSEEFVVCSLHYFLIEHPDGAVVPVCVGGPHTGPAQVEQVPGVGELVPAAGVVRHTEVGDAAEPGTGPEAQHRAVIGSKQDKTGEQKQFHGFEIFDLLTGQNVFLYSFMHWNYGELRRVTDKTFETA